MSFHKIYPYIFGLILLALFTTPLFAENVVLVIIDGARYTETFGDPFRYHVPYMTEIAEEGIYNDEFYNDGFTYTSRAIPAIWCGAWTEVRDTTYNGRDTQYTQNPSIFEYFRHDTGVPQSQCYYVLKYVSSLWLPSFHPDYGPDYWPTFISEGSDDLDVLDNALEVIEEEHPQFLLVYFADVDHYGHTGVWADYLRAIEIADSAVGVLWDTIQSDEVYAGNTTMIVTNDHGRHDDAHGGFSGHGCDCQGCRHIMLLAVGPGIRAGEVTEEYRTIPDIAVTISDILDIDHVEATGEVMVELFEEDEVDDTRQSTMPDDVILRQNYPNPFNPSTTVSYTLHQPGWARVSIFNSVGQQITTLADCNHAVGTHIVEVSTDGWASGVYLYRLETSAGVYTKRMMLVK